MYGVCVPTEAKACQYKCVCQSGYTGEKCDQVIGESIFKKNPKESRFNAVHTNALFGYIFCTND